MASDKNYRVLSSEHLALKPTQHVYMTHNAHMLAYAAMMSGREKEAMAAKLKTDSGRKLYAARKHIVEPVFGQIKHVRGFRQFLRRGLECVSAEWQLLCLTHNLLKIWRHQMLPV